jgi:hypothetical protein
VTLCNGLQCFLEFDITCEQRLTDRLEGLMFHRYLVELKGDSNLILMGEKKESGSESRPE